MFFQSWDVIVLFVISLASVVAQMTINGYYIKKNPMKTSEHYLKAVGLSISGGLAIFAINSFSINLSTFSLLLGIAFGVCLSLSQVSLSLSIKSGPYGYSNVITNFSTVITALSSFLFWGEEISVFKLVGIVFMLACFYFAVETKDDKKTNLKWFIFAVMSMLSCAGIGLLQKTHQLSSFKGELMGFLFIAFIFSAIGSLIVFFILRNNEKKLEPSGENRLFTSKRHVKWFIMTIVLCGVFMSFNHVLNLFLSGKVDTVIFFPIVNGIPLIASLLVSFVFFKEKMSKRQWIGIIIGVIGLSLLFF